jgi:surfactin synthase thioesterase subunit
VATLADVLHPLTTLPYAFLGHSLGALMGFELARELARRRQTGPLRLFVSGCRAPQIPNPDPPRHGLPDAAFIAELRRLKGTPPELLNNADLMELTLPMLRADFALYETYTYASDEPLNLPISAFAGQHDREVPPNDIAAWRAQARGTFVLRILPGDHFFLHSAQPAVLQAVAKDLGCAGCSG